MERQSIQADQRLPAVSSMSSTRASWLTGQGEKVPFCLMITMPSVSPDAALTGSAACSAGPSR